MTDEVVYAPIPGFLGYEVGTDGNVWSWRGPGGKVTERHLLIPKTTKKGYKIVTLRSKLNGNRRFFSIAWFFWPLLALALEEWNVAIGMGIPQITGYPICVGIHIKQIVRILSEMAG
jgi:hypothetical protein